MHLQATRQRTTLSTTITNGAQESNAYVLNNRQTPSSLPPFLSYTFHPLIAARFSSMASSICLVWVGNSFRPESLSINPVCLSSLSFSCSCTWSEMVVLVFALWIFKCFRVVWIFRHRFIVVLVLRLGHPPFDFLCFCVILQRHASYSGDLGKRREWKTGQWLSSFEVGCPTTVNEEKNLQRVSLVLDKY